MIECSDQLAMVNMCYRWIYTHLWRLYYNFLFIIFYHTIREHESEVGPKRKQIVSSFQYSFSISQHDNMISGSKNSNVLFIFIIFIFSSSTSKSPSRCSNRKKKHSVCANIILHCICNNKNNKNVLVSLLFCLLSSCSIHLICLETLAHNAI